MRLPVVGIMTASPRVGVVRQGGMIIALGLLAAAARSGRVEVFLGQFRVSSHTNLLDRGRRRWRGRMAWRRRVVTAKILLREA